MASRKNLGESPKPIGEPATLLLADLTPGPGNREVRMDDDLKALAKSIGEVGLIYPIVVKADPEEKGRYRIIAGERRWRAMRHLKLDAAPCIIVEDQEDAARAEVLGVVENHQRRNLTPLEEAAAVRALLDVGYEPAAVARSLGRSRAWVARRSSLTELSERWLAESKNAESKISEWPPSHLEAVARFPADVQDRMLEAWERQWRYQVPTLQDLESVTGNYVRLLASAPWKPEDETLCPQAGACAACPKRSSRHPDLFAEEMPVDGKPVAGDRCLDPACWHEKARAYLARRVEEVRKDHPEAILISTTEEDDDVPDLERELGADVFSSADLTACKKSDRKAVPALVVSGPGLGRIKYVQPMRSARPVESGEAASNGNGRNAPQPYEVAEKTAEQKREPYDKRRRQLVIEAVQTRLRALADAPGLEEAKAAEGGTTLACKGLLLRTLALLRALLGEHGWRANASGSLEMPDAFAWPSLDGYKNHETGTGETRDAAMALCWELLRLALAKMASRLALGMGERTNDLQFAEAEQFAFMLGFDLNALRAEAAAAIPYAKSWKDQVTDGWAAPNGASPDAASDPSEESPPSAASRRRRASDAALAPQG